LRPRVAILGSIAAAAVVVAAVIAGPASGVTSTSFFLDSYNANNASGGNSITGPQVLVNGQTYALTVQGTFSPWASWSHRRCGLPEPSAVYPSPAADHQPVTAVSDDAVFRFAQNVDPGPCPSYPRRSFQFQINLGSGWKPFVPDGGVPAAPSDTSSDAANDTHPYHKTIVGQGVKPMFRIVDHHPSDNNGQFKITIG